MLLRGSRKASRSGRVHDSLPLGSGQSVMHSSSPDRKKKRKRHLRACCTHKHSVAQHRADTDTRVNTARNTRSAAQQNVARDARVHHTHVSAPQPCVPFLFLCRRLFCTSSFLRCVRDATSPSDAEGRGGHAEISQSRTIPPTISPSMRDIDVRAASTAV